VALKIISRITLFHS